MNQPLVTAVMITGKHEARLPLALAAVRSYQQQTHQNKRLMIVTDGFSVWDHIPHPDDSIREVSVHKMSLGELRNVALDNIRPDEQFVCQFDDDDWSGPQRIELQLAAAQQHPGCAVTLRQQVRYSFETCSAFVARMEPELGIPGTILHPVTPLRYPALGKHEDSHFLKSFSSIHVLEAAPELYLRFHTDFSTWDIKHVMGRRALEKMQIRLPPSASRYLMTVLALQYCDFQGAAT